MRALPWERAPVISLPMTFLKIRANLGPVPKVIDLSINRTSATLVKSANDEPHHYGYWCLGNPPRPRGSTPCLGRQLFQKIAPPLHTCEGVLAETLDLLADLPASCQALAQLHEEKILIASFDFESQATAIWKLLKKYQDQPMDFADACLVRMSELQENSQLWTVDSDFRSYRRNSRHSIPMICP
jgi:uncharacterized protein